MGRLVRVVQAGRAVTEDRTPGGKTPRSGRSRAAPSPRSASSRQRSKPRCPVSGPGVSSVRSSCKRVTGGGIDKSAQCPIEPRRVPRKEGARHQRDRGQNADHSREQRPEGQRPAPHVEPIRGHSQGTPAFSGAAGGHVRGCRSPARRPSARDVSLPGKAVRNAHRQPRDSTSRPRKSRQCRRSSTSGANSSR